MKDIILIKQPAGLGDIFFCQKIAKRLVKYGYDIIWPVLPQFKYIEDYLAYDCISYPSVMDKYDYNNMYNFHDPKSPQGIVQHTSETDRQISLVNLQNASYYFKDGNFMYNKYDLVRLGFEDWQNWFTFKRSYDREERLFRYCDLSPGDEYILVNRTFASPPDIQTANSIPKSFKGKVIEMQFLGWDNLFDWCKIIENAKEIHTVETSICYLIEKLSIKAETLNMYARNRAPDFTYIKKIFSKSWKYEGE